MPGPHSHYAFLPEDKMGRCVLLGSALLLIRDNMVGGFRKPDLSQVSISMWSHTKNGPLSAL